VLVMMVKTWSINERRAEECDIICHCRLGQYAKVPIRQFVTALALRTQNVEHMHSIGFQVLFRAFGSQVYISKVNKGTSSS